MIELSAECLSAEFQVLAPKMILITDFAEGLLPYVKEKLNFLDTRLDGVVNHPLYHTGPDRHTMNGRIIQRLATPDQETDPLH